jgi:predicted nucleotidyltransferase
MDRTTIIEATRDTLRSRAHEIVAAYLFGSVARGDHTPRSDVDLAVLLKQQPAAGLAGLGFDIAAALEHALHRPVDVIILNEASPDLVHRVLRDGVLVLESDRRARVAFEVRARAQYFDLAPLRRLYRRHPALPRADVSQRSESGEPHDG